MCADEFSAGVRPKLQDVSPEVDVHETIFLGRF